MSCVRLRYSGLILFASRLVSTLAGIIFALMIVRKLTPFEYGLWFFLGAFASYFIMPSNFLSYWMTRDVARGLRASKTGLMANLTISIVALLFFILLSSPTAISVNAPEYLFLLYGLQIPVVYTIISLEAVADAVKPEVKGYGLSLSNFLKVVFCILLMLYSRLDLIGIIVAVLVASLVQALYLALVLREHLYGGIDMSFLKKWFKVLWIPIYRLSPQIPFTLTFMVIAWIMGSTVPLAYLSAPTVIAGFVGFTAALAVGLYPRLLSGGSERDVEETLKLVLMFAIPMLFGITVLARPLLYVLRPEYEVAWLILIVLAVKELIKTMRIVLSYVLLGIERVECRESTTLKDYVKSFHFLVPTVTLIVNVFTLVFATVVFLIGLGYGIHFIDLLLCYLLLRLVFLQIPMICYFWCKAKEVLPFKLPSYNVFKYVIASLVMSLMLWWLYPNEIYCSNSILEAIPYLIYHVLLASLVYILVLIAIDNDSRKLLKLIKREFMLKLAEFGFA